MSLKLITAWPSSDEEDDFEVKSEAGDADIKSEADLKSEPANDENEPDVEFLHWLKTSADEDVKVKSEPGRQPQNIIDTLSLFL